MEAWPTWILRQELKPALEVVQIGVGDLASELTCCAHHLHQAHTAPSLVLLWQFDSKLRKTKTQTRKRCTALITCLLQLVQPLCQPRSNSCTHDSWLQDQLVTASNVFTRMCTVGALMQASSPA